MGVIMKLLVFSDTHGSTDVLHDIISRNKLNCDIVIHLGDNLRDAQEVMCDFPEIAFLGVLGNCDYPLLYANEKYEGAFTAENRRLFYTHGHKFNVNYGIEYLVSNAKFNNADIALYGHTHVAMCKEMSGITVINPGSLSLPRDRSNGTYACIEILREKTVCRIVEVE